LALEPPKVWGGGGIFNQGTVFLNNDTFRDNWVPSDSESDPWCCNGGAILNDSTGQMTVMNSRLIGDYTDANYHALFGGLVSNAGKLSLNSTIVSNAVANYGGGIFNEGDLDVINTTIFIC
jgi:hypothetical protein